MSDNFFDFLNKMDSQFSQNSKSQDSKFVVDDEEDFDNDDEELDDDYDNDDDDFIDEENNNIEKENDDEFEENNNIEKENDDIIEKSLDYAKSVLKVVKENFKGKDQRIMFETLRNTLNMYLNETATPSSQQYIPRTESQISVQQSQVSPMLRGSTITEEEWNKLNVDDGTENFYVQNKQTPVEQLSPNINESKDREYNKDLPLAIRINADGKPEVDLSKITSRDMEDMKILMGLK